MELSAYTKLKKFRFLLAKKEGLIGFLILPGGGGTYVVRGSSTPLIIAGSGGGMETVTSRHAGCDANTSTTGNPGYRSWSGGSNGYGADC